MKYLRPSLLEMLWFFYNNRPFQKTWLSARRNVRNGYNLAAVRHGEMAEWSRGPEGRDKSSIGNKIKKNVPFVHAAEDAFGGNPAGMHELQSNQYFDTERWQSGRSLPKEARRNFPIRTKINK
jgi:hypothetical protein